MKKIFSLVIFINLAFGINFNFNGSEANASIDNLAYKGKIFTQMLDMFLSENAPKINALEQNLTTAFNDLNKTVNQFSNELLGIQAYILNSLEDANFSANSLNDKNLFSVLFDNNISNLTNSISVSAKNSEIKDISNLNSKLINSVSVLKQNGNFEVEIYGDSKIEGKYFRDLASKSADIVRKYNNFSGKVRVYYFHDESKFSGKF